MTGRPVLITGGAGFIGANLADALARDGQPVLVYDALVRPGVARNLAWLQARHPGLIQSITADIRDSETLKRAVVGVEAVFHFAAQVAVTTSLESPHTDAEVNLVGTLHLLEAIRAQDRRIPVLFASTNKVYGDLPDIALDRFGDAYLPVDHALRARGIGEERPLDFHTPYGCSKGAADQYVLDYARSFNLPTAVFRMSCIYGPRQMGTEDQGWVAHFLIRALEGLPITLYGDGAQVRDILYVRDAVAVYRSALARIEAIKGRAFNLGGGPPNAVSLLQVLDHISALTGRPIERHVRAWRQGDQRYYVSDTRAVSTALGLGAVMDWRDGIADLARWLAEERGMTLVLTPLAGAAE